MALTSPGVEVTIIDQSQYLPTAVSSVPFLMVATAQNKQNASGTGIAPGTLETNANRLYQVTSQRDLVTLFGNPFFYKTTNGTPIQGYELNEYGLLAAYSLLDSTNLCYVMRADVDLAQLIGRVSRPVGAPIDATYWLDTVNSTWGINEWNGTTSSFTYKTPIVYENPGDLTDTGTPNSVDGVPGDYAIVPQPAIGLPAGSLGPGSGPFGQSEWDNGITAPDTTSVYWYKAPPADYAQLGSIQEGGWFGVGTPEWRLANPMFVGPQVSGTFTNQDPTNTQSVTIRFSDEISGRTTGETNPDVNPGVVVSLTVGPVPADGGMIDYSVILNDIINALAPSGTSATAINVDSIGAGRLILRAGDADIVARISMDYVGTSANLATAIAQNIFGLRPSQVPQPDDASGPPYVDTSVILGLAPLTSYAPSSGNRPVWTSQPAYPVDIMDPDRGYVAARPARPSGSVWVNLSESSTGFDSVMSQYSASADAFTSVPVRTSTSDWAIISSLDSTGGKNIPAGTAYVQSNYDASNFGSINSEFPLQYFRKTSSGATTYVGSSPAGTNPAFVAGHQFTIQWSVAGQSSLSTPVTVDIPAPMTGTTVVTPAQVVTAINSAVGMNSPVMASLVNGYIIFEHADGGIIVLADLIATGGANPSYGTSVGSLGFIRGQSTAKYGPFLTTTYTDVVGTVDMTTSVTLDITVTGHEVSATPTGTQMGTVTVGTILTVLQAGVYAYTFIVTAVTGTQATAVVPITSSIIIGQPGNFFPVYYSTQLSNWQKLFFEPNDVAPNTVPANGTNWFYSVVDQVDIMVKSNGFLDNTMTPPMIREAGWYGYRQVNFGDDGLVLNVFNGAVTDPNGPIISATPPLLRSDGNAPVFGDLWIDTSDLENYPMIYRWTYSQDTPDGSWVLIDNADQTSPNGIVFADARWAPNRTIDPADDAIPTIQSMLTSNYTDLDAPDDSLYPQGTLLFNTRRSGYNVKEFRTNYFTRSNFPNATLDDLPTASYTWVTVSGNKSDGSPYMGRKAQRALIVAAMRAGMTTSSEIREEDTFFNLIATPGYPELQPDMVTLNNARNQTAYIVGDTPLRLADDANAITAWARNSAGATSTGEDGLVTRDTYLGIYYPSGITTDLTGAEVVVPSSHMILKTMLYNDTVAYPWFAPAGQRRGIVSNVTNIGYIDGETGEFQVTKNRVALRDVEYTNFINPIAYFTNVGILNYGNKNSFDSQSALDRTNVSRLIAYLRERLQIAVRPFIFEPNDPITRTQVRGVIQSLLADVQAKRGVYDYLVVCDDTNNTPARIDRNELWVDIAIEPTKSVEFIYIPVRVLNTGEISGG